MKRPHRSIPRAIATAIGVITLLYLGIQVVTQGILGDSLARSTVPLADAMARISPALRALMVVGAAVSMFGYLSADILGSPRMLFAYARHGLLPSSLGRLHARSNVPHVAIICYGVIAMVLAITGTFAELAVLSTLTAAVLYLLGCSAAWLLVRRGVAESGPPLALKGLPTAAVIGIVSILGAIALASQEEILGLAALIAVCVGGYWLHTRDGQPSVTLRIGRAPARQRAPLREWAWTDYNSSQSCALERRHRLADDRRSKKSALEIAYMSAPHDLKDIYADEMKDLWSANDQMTKAVTMMAGKATDTKLKQALQKSVTDIGKHADLLKNLLSSAGESVEKEHCKGMEGLVKEASKHVGEDGGKRGDLLDIVILAQYQRMSHYGLAGFGTAAAYAEALGMKEHASTLHSIVADIHKGDDYASKLAEKSEAAAKAA